MASRILIVEDDADLAGLIEASLQGEGFETRLATRADETLRLVDEFTPEAVILDMVLAGEEGSGLHEKLLRSSLPPRAPIVVLTVLTERDAMSRARFDGRTYYVAKPFKPLHFLAVVRQALVIAADSVPA